MASPSPPSSLLVTQGLGGASLFVGGFPPENPFLFGFTAVLDLTQNIANSTYRAELLAFTAAQPAALSPRAHWRPRQARAADARAAAHKMPALPARGVGVRVPRASPLQVRGVFFLRQGPLWPWGRALRSQCTAEHDAPPHEPAQHVTPTTNTHTRAGRGKAAASPCAPRCS